MKIEPSHLLKLRLAVARFGEMDGAGWWNTKGILGPTGKSALSRGFPETHLFAQTRIACAVATARCNSIFAPPGCLTLWNLPAEVEDQIAAAWPIWCRSPDSWLPFFDDLAGRNSGNLVQHLRELELIDPKTEAAVVPLKRSAEGKSVPLPGTGKPDLATLMLLAAAFSKGEKLKPAIPYIRRDS
ncbi:MAG: BrxE family protein [Verrucomicrobia bacterium]|nr:BrxE family protein [Verrucomicrobiota bacterium]